jgi:hypothetical protein
MIRNTERALAAHRERTRRARARRSRRVLADAGYRHQRHMRQSPARGKVLVAPDARYGEAGGRAGPAVYPLVRCVLATPHGHDLYRDRARRRADQLSAIKRFKLLKLHHHRPAAPIPDHGGSPRRGRPRRSRSARRPDRRCGSPSASAAAARVGCFDAPSAVPLEDPLAGIGEQHHRAASCCPRSTGPERYFRTGSAVPSTWASRRPGPWRRDHCLGRTRASLPLPARYWYRVVGIAEAAWTGAWRGLSYGPVVERIGSNRPVERRCRRR